MKKGILLILLISLTISLAGCGSSNSTSLNDSSITPISVRLPIPVQDAAFAPFFASIDQGFYEEEGLDVEFTFGSQQANPAKMVATGVDDFGVLGGPDTLLVARSQGLPLQAFAIMHQYSHFPVLVTRADSGITTVEQLEGKKIGFFYGHISTDVLRNLFRKTGVTVEEVDIGFDFTQLIAGKIDAQFGFWTHAPFYFAQQGVDVVVISPKEYGINTHGYTLFATEQTLQENPELAEKFWRATVKGIEFTFENPQEALVSITSRDTNLNHDIELEKLLLYNDVMQRPYGYMDQIMFQETYDRLEEEGVLVEQFNLQEAYTHDILTSIFPQAIFE